MFEVVLTDRAKDEYESSPPAMRKKLDRCFHQLAQTPPRHPNIRALKGPLSGYWRYRVRDHRVVYRIDDAGKVIIVLLIGNRRDVYE